MRLVLVVVFFVLLDFFGSSQNIPQAKKEEDTVYKHSVKKAVLLSTCIPGAGQVYNHFAMPKGRKKAFWKVPLIYASLGTASYFIIQNQITQSSIKNEYTNRIDGNVVLNPFWEAYDNQALLTLHRQYLDFRDLSMLAFFALYGFQIADAGVEAHFVKFDVSNDISLLIKPKMLHFNHVGVSLQFNFH
jgi:hypothetical protein